MLEWLSQQETALWWIALASLAMFLGSLLAIPLLVARIPVDYFADEQRHSGGLQRRHPLTRAVLLLLKNLTGVLLLLAGVIMLFTPGQGLLSVLLGLMLTDFPGKYRLERWLIGQRSVSRTINWIRVRSGHPPLRLPARDQTMPDRPTR